MMKLELFTSHYFMSHCLVFSSLHLSHSQTHAGTHVHVVHMCVHTNKLSVNHNKVSKVINMTHYHKTEINLKL